MGGETDDGRQAGRDEGDTPDGAGERGDQRRTVTVGLISDPGLPTDCLGSFVERLNDDLNDQVTGDVIWEVEHYSQPLVLDGTGNVPIAQLADQLLSSRGWDLVLFLTDLPRRLGTTPVVGDLSIGHSAALVSMPAIGGVGRVRTRLRYTLIYLIGELGRARLGYGDPERMRQRAGGRFTPVHWIDNPAEEIEVALALTGWRGRARLLFGMLRDNKPWRLVPELSSALTAGFAVAAFGIFYSSIWSLADALSPARLLLINVLAVSAMVTWLIYYNNLWQPQQDLRERARLYNTATVLTLSIGVVAAYVVLFLTTLLGALAVIDVDYLSQSLGHPASIGSYVYLAWLSASMGTVGGALGSSLEDEEAVHRATYSKRERQRRERFQQEKEQREQRERRNGDGDRTSERG